MPISKAVRSYSTRRSTTSGLASSASSFASPSRRGSACSCRAAARSTASTGRSTTAATSSADMQRRACESAAAPATSSCSPAWSSVSTRIPLASAPNNGCSPGSAYSVDNRMMKVRFLVLLALAATTASLAAAVRPNKLQYQMMTLPNGLTVVLEEDHSTPIVHLQLWYHVGSKNEKRGRTGFAHLFEHLMFKGSRNVQPEAHTSMIASVGGQSNAYTTDDETVFWETVPAQYLPMILWMEADRMATLRVDKETFVAEREVVKEERRMRVDNQPYGRLNEIIYDQAFTVHPYKHPTIGSMADLEAATIEDVQDFYHTYYVPSNATLVLVGDFDSGQAVELVNQYMGRVPKASKPVPRDIPKEPPQTKEKRAAIQVPVPLPAVVVAYHITKDGNPDSYPLHIVGKVL